MSRVHDWDRLTRNEVGELAREALTVIPVGATEQHGPHLATGTDALIAEGVPEVEARGYGNFFDPSSLCRQNTFITPENDSEYKPRAFYYTDALSDNAVRFLQQHQQDSPGKPFFLYLAYTAAHWPMQALAKDIAKYRGRYQAGYGPVAAARWEKQKQLGVVQAAWGLPPPAEDWAQVKSREFEARCMEVYAAMIDCMDQGIGRLVAELARDLDRELGVEALVDGRHDAA